MDITVIGSLNIDFVVNVDFLPKVGETIKGGELSIITGGKGANQAVACALHGNSVSMIGKVGNDFYGKLIKNNLKSKGINTSGIKIERSTPTGTAMIMVDKNGDNCIVISSGANGKVSSDDIRKNEKLIAKSKLVLLQLEIPINSVVYAIEISNFYGVPVFLNPAPAEKLPIEIYKKIDILIPNVSEAALLTNIDIVDNKTASEAAYALLEFGARNVIITLGKNGALLVNEKEYVISPSVQVDVIDTTGAGDAFIGGFASAYIRGEKLAEALEYANYSGAFAVTKKGAQGLIQSEEEVRNFIKSRTDQKKNML